MDYDSHTYKLSAIMPDENSGFIFQGEGQKQNFPKSYQRLTLV